MRALRTAGAALLAVAALAVWGGGTADAAHGVDYVRNAGGFVGGEVHVHVSAGGIATVSGDYVRDCTGARLPAKQRHRLQRVLKDARLAHTRSRIEYAAEAPSREFRSAGHDVEFVGWRRLPKRIERLAKELEAVANTACRS